MSIISKSPEHSCLRRIHRDHKTKYKQHPPRPIDKHCPHPHPGDRPQRLRPHHKLPGQEPIDQYLSGGRLQFRGHRAEENQYAVMAITNPGGSLSVCTRATEICAQSAGVYRV